MQLQGKWCVIFLLLLCRTAGLLAQKPFVSASTTENSYNGSKQVVSYNDGSYITLKHNTIAGGQKILLAKTDRCHNTLWSCQIRLLYENEPVIYKEISGTSDRGCVIAYIQRPDYATPQGIVTKIDSQGNAAWSKRIGNTASSTNYLNITSISCIQDTYGDYIISATADSTSITGSHYDFILQQKLDKNGRLRWSKKYSLVAAGIVKVVALKDGYCVLTSDRYMLMRTDTAGYLKWVKEIGLPVISPPNENAINVISIDRDNSDSIYLNGVVMYEVPPYTYRSYPFIVKLSSSGNMAWIRYYSDSTSGYYTYSSDMITTLEGRIVFVMKENRSGGRPVLPSKVILAALNSNGFPVWCRHISSLSGGGLTPLFTLCNTADSGLIVGGPDNSSNALTIKTDRRGYTPCGADTTPLVAHTTTVKLTPVAALTSEGFGISDTAIYTTPFKSKETIICGDFYSKADLGNDTIICNDTSYTLTAGQPNPNCTYTWSTGSTDTAITIHKSGKYWLSVNHGSCTATDTVNEVFYKQIKRLKEHVRYTCPYDSALLATPDSSVNTVWVTPNGKEINKKRIWARDTGYYYIKLNGNGTCLALDSIYIGHYALPKASAGPDTLLCYNQRYTMQGKGGITYRWTPAQYLSSDTLPDAIAKAPITQQYTLVVRNTHGCADTSTVWLKVRPPLSVRITGGITGSYCYGDSIKLTAVAKGGDSMRYSFYWTNDDAQGKQLHTRGYASAWHKIVLQDGCSPDAVDSVYIKVPPALIAAFDIAPATAAAGDEVSFINQSQNSQHYYWSFGDSSNSSSTAFSPLHVYADTGRHQVWLIAYGANGCRDTATGYIYIQDNFHVYIPNAFSPNDDGLNELFQIKGTAIASYSYSIYNRWGECIFQSSATQPYWNGSVHNQGETIQEGVYLYMLKVRALGGREYYYSGTLHLVR